MENIRITFGRKLKALRRQLNWSQEKLGEKADLHPTYVSGIEQGVRNVSLESIEKIASAFGMTVAELLNFALEGTKRDQLQSELLVLIRQQNAETSRFLLDYVKTLDQWDIKPRKKRHPKN
jgi:transcriptional regulator with XRE-family HTH domain